MSLVLRADPSDPMSRSTKAERRARISTAGYQDARGLLARRQAVPRLSRDGRRPLSIPGMTSIPRHPRVEMARQYMRGSEPMPTTPTLSLDAPFPECTAMRELRDTLRRIAPTRRLSGSSPTSTDCRITIRHGSSMRSAIEVSDSRQRQFPPPLFPNVSARP
jgi:hypothetical protein